MNLLNSDLPYDSLCPTLMKFKRFEQQLLTSHLGNELTQMVTSMPKNIESGQRTESQTTFRPQARMSSRENEDNEIYCSNIEIIPSEKKEIEPI